ncbi:hypothetical protein TorRG33x02_127000, partial [Trema orientale]
YAENCFERRNLGHGSVELLFAKVKRGNFQWCNNGGWSYSPRLSAVHGIDDPFHQEHFSKGSSCDTYD